MNEETITETTNPAAVAETPDVDILRRENEGLRQAVRTAAAREAVTDALRVAGARSPGLLFASAEGDLQFADDGTLVNGAAIVEQLKAKFPEQFGTVRPSASIDGGAGRPARPALTKAALARMSPAEIGRLDWDVVRNVLANG